MKKNPFNGGKGKRGSSGSDNGWIYALLCLGIIAFIVRIYWTSSPGGTAQNPVPLATNQSPVARKKGLEPIVVSLEPTSKPAIPVPTTSHPVTNSAPSAPATDLGPLGLSSSNVPLIPLPVPALQPKPQPVPQQVIQPSIAPMLAAQIELVRQGFSPGSIDGKGGAQTHSALLAYQQSEGLSATGELNAATKAKLFTADAPMTSYVITSNDLARLMPLPTTWLGKSEAPRLDYETILELLGEKSMSHPQLIRDLNPGVNWNKITAGTSVVLPDVQYPTIDGKAAFIRISLQNRRLEVFDEDTNLLVHFPCSIGHLAEKRPVGELKIDVIIFDPNYTFNPEVFPESAEAKSVGRKLIIPAGPNNPVGMAWIGLNRPGYGIHGTPGPEQVGRTESHGCFRLANWNAVYLAHIVSLNTAVYVEP